MSTQKIDPIMDIILSNEELRGIFNEFNIVDVSPKVQESMLMIAGKMILEHVLLELLIALPETDRDEFELLLGGGDAKKLESFLRNHIQDLDGFLRHETTKQYETIKTGLHQILQGVSE